MTIRTPVSRVYGRRPAFLALTVALAIVSAWAPPAAGQLDALQILTQLGHSDYAQRQRASHQLLADQDLTQEQIDNLYARTTSVEQRHRLLDVARHHLLRRIGEQVEAVSGEAALGVGLQPIERGQISELDRGGCYVTKTYPGLPAFALLTAGDIILAIDREDTDEKSRGNETDFFIKAIKAHAPGDTIDIKVRREGRTIQINVKLASREALETLYDQQLRRRMWLLGNIDSRAGVRRGPDVADGIPLGREYEQMWQQRKQELQALVSSAAAPQAAE